MNKAIITIEYLGKKITIEQDEVLTTHDFGELFRSALLALEFHPESVNDLFYEE